MASSHNDLEENLMCSICTDIFKDPVVLHCSHSFCGGCIETYWASKQVKLCPICRNTSKRTPVKNLALKGACEYLIKEKRSRTSAYNVFCDVHHFTSSQLFCTDDQKLVCMKCVSEEHKTHNFCSVEKAAEEHKIKLQKPLQDLQSKIESLISKDSTFSAAATNLQVQGTQIETQIKAEFTKLREFLRVEEESRISTLRNEQNTKRERIMEKIAEVKGSQTLISERIKNAQEDMGRDDGVFLHKFRNTKESLEITVPDTTLESDLQINSVKHIANLRYGVWEKMKALSPYYPVILDPNTKFPNIDVSSDLTSVSVPGSASQVPVNKFSSRNILGSEGFVSGVHSWQVDVGGCQNWAIGVKILQSGSDDSSLVYYINGKCSWNPVAPKISKVRVFLDMTNNQVVFSDPDTDATLKTHIYISAEKIYPCFVPLSRIPMKILPSV